MPFTTYEAEDAITDGEVIGADRQFGTLPSEASGRHAVRLERVGNSVGFILTAPANAVTLRYAISDGETGIGRSGALAIEVGGVRLAVARLTSRFGWFYGKYPFTNRPSDGLGHHFYDEVRVMLPRVLPMGARVVVRRIVKDTHGWVVLDLADFETVPAPRPRPRGALSVTAYGADPRGRRPAATAFRAALKAASAANRPLYLPPGRYRIDGHLTVDNVRMIGSGAWSTVLTGHNIGLFARQAPRGSSNVTLSDFAIEGDVDERDDHAPLSAIGGAFNRTVISNLYLHHMKVGIWLDGPLHDLIIRGVRITDQTADGINLHVSARRVTIEQNFIRNSGDDGIALWSEKVTDRDIVIRHNTVIAPILANGIAIYGGRDIEVSDNLIADTLTQGGGIHLGTRFKSLPFAGRIAISRNRIVRGGSFDPNWRFDVGAMWLYALERPITGAEILFTDNVLLESSCEGLQLLGPKPISGVMFNGLSVGSADGAATAPRSPGATQPDHCPP